MKKVLKVSALYLSLSLVILTGTFFSAFLTAVGALEMIRIHLI